MFLISLTILLVLIISSLCSVVEAALFSVSINRVKIWVEKKIRYSEFLLKVKESFPKSIASIVILNNISNIVGSLIIGILMTDLFSQVWIGIISTIFTFILIVFAEIIPKNLGESYSDDIALISAKSVLTLTKILTPFLIIIEWITKPIYKKPQYPTISEEEIRVLARIGSSQGVLDQEGASIIYRALQLNQIRVKEIMTPRIKMIAFNENEKLKNIYSEILKNPFSRFPVFNENRDRVTGILDKTDALKKMINGNRDSNLSEIKKECLFIPENKPIHKLLKELRNTQFHIAIVIDQYGGTAGLVTLEDVLEEIVGEIIGSGNSDSQKYYTVSEDEIIAFGMTMIDQVNEYFNTTISNHRGTISKFILDDLNRFPKPSEEISYGNLIFIVEEVTEKTIEKVRIKRKK